MGRNPLPVEVARGHGYPTLLLEDPGELLRDGTPGRVEPVQEGSGGVRNRTSSRRASLGSERSSAPMRSSRIPGTSQSRPWPLTWLSCAAGMHGDPVGGLLGDYERNLTTINKKSSVWNDRY